jgi:hypothetical protein
MANSPLWGHYLKAKRAEDHRLGLHDRIALRPRWQTTSSYGL